ncbi:phage terminase small subunit [Paenibacillus ginsengarvi]|uniref:Terminase n=1 Tax=Paenibacillus ginsengarvi TaxID=400777 RepID=A0A3B0BRK9_9BACL|nr:phage terminase small subunit [Paenibacillus ginsengarvi]RKN75014.1 terminase [Paenibacillus ginsengarvi]
MARDPNRDKAKEIWHEHQGKITNRRIAELLEVNEKKVAVWKQRDKWNVVQQDAENVVQQPETDVVQRKKIGAPKGNKNAVGNKGGAPPGNKRAVGNKGGHGGPPGNKKAVRTGEFETIWLDALDEDEQELLEAIDTDPVSQADETIALLALRERRMLKRIQQLKSGLTEKQRNILRELRTVKEAKPVTDPKTNKQTTVVTEVEKMVVARIETTTFRVLEDILRIEDALTRVQGQKLKAIELKNRLVDEEKAARIEKLRAEIELLNRGNDTDDETEGDSLDSLTKAIEDSMKLLQSRRDS